MLAQIFSGPIDPDYAELLYKDLKKAGEPLVLSTHLHLLYLVTPYDMVEGISPSWFLYFNQVITQDYILLYACWVVFHAIVDVIC